MSLKRPRSLLEDDEELDFDGDGDTSDHEGEPAAQPAGARVAGAIFTASNVRRCRLACSCDAVLVALPRGAAGSSTVLTRCRDDRMPRHRWKSYAPRRSARRRMWRSCRSLAGPSAPRRPSRVNGACQHTRARANNI